MRFIEERVAEIERLCSKVVRLWAALQMGEGDYLTWRDELFAGESVDTLFEKVQAYQVAQKAKEDA